MTLLRDHSRDHLLGGPPRRTAPAAITVGFVAALVIGTAILIATGGPRGAADASPAHASPGHAAPLATPAASDSAAGLDGGPIELPQPTGYVDGVPTGYPHSTSGAVAAAYGYSRIASGLDVDATLTALESIADPDAGWFPRERSSLADGLVAQRTALGLSPVGSPAAASFTITPAGYQVLAMVPSPGEVHVLTLNVVSASSVDGTRTAGTVVLDWSLRWDGDRWRVVAPFDGSEHDALAVAPLTREAVALGWREARGG